MPRCVANDEATVGLLDRAAGSGTETAWRNHRSVAAGGAERSTATIAASSYLPPQRPQFVAENWIGLGVPFLTLRTCRVAVPKLGRP